MIRRHDPEAYRDQSAVIPYRWRKKDVQVCLITSMRARHWIVPKGIIEPDLSPPASAAKEALEEAGVEGHVWSKKIGEYEIEKAGGVCRVRTYLMRVDSIHDDWPEAPWRKRRWVTLDSARDRVHHDGLAAIIDKVPRWIRKLDR